MLRSTSVLLPAQETTTTSEPETTTTSEPETTTSSTLETTTTSEPETTTTWDCVGNYFPEQCPDVSTTTTITVIPPTVIDPVQSQADVLGLGLVMVFMVGLAAGLVGFRKG